MGSLILLFIPLYVIMIWQFFNPKESILWGRRWMYKEEPNVTEKAITHAKVTSVIGIVFLTIVLIILFFI
ncbi:hypothetical protein [Psychrobacillus sp. FJAT-21963]|uniref:hypothetical protein n=1 Tax=Psychrobacillus sp. FJAT-21963 TaxID=1712028 RepID=UPI0006F7B73B|nr:hypothetical protein [Psychrobacillus sp. FJAT-21963]